FKIMNQKINMIKDNHQIILHEENIQKNNNTKIIVHLNLLHKEKQDRLNLLHKEKQDRLNLLHKEKVVHLIEKLNKNIEKLNLFVLRPKKDKMIHILNMILY